MELAHLEIRTESKVVQNPNWESSYFDKIEESEYFMSGPERVQTIQNWTDVAPL